MFSSSNQLVFISTVDVLPEERWQYNPSRPGFDYLGTIQAELDAPEVVAAIEGWYGGGRRLLVTEHVEPVNGGSGLSRRWHFLSPGDWLVIDQNSILGVAKLNVH